MENSNLERVPLKLKYLRDHNILQLAIAREILGDQFDDDQILARMMDGTWDDLRLVLDNHYDEIEQVFTRSAGKEKDRLILELAKKLAPEVDESRKKTQGTEQDINMLQ